MMKLVSLAHATRLFVAGGVMVFAANALAAPPPPINTRAFDAPSPYTAVTAKAFADACRSDESSCAAMVGEVLMDRMQFSPTSHICLPGISYANAVGPWLESHPEAASLSARDGIYLAITTVYKCGPPNNY
jgi:hypothetical protein